ncbi:prephenate dehydratase [Xylariaceae sp. FL0804]|nr:prephenate dehydratase [Xylariaceae sp. FL0804]
MASNGHNGSIREDGGTAPGQKPVVCFLGPATSYTHQATLKAFPEDRFELMPVKTIKDVFDTTQAGRAAYGVTPFENSSNGSVWPALDCLADRAGAYPDLRVCREVLLVVHHCIVGYPAPPPALPSPSSSSSSSPSSSSPPSPSSSSSPNNADATVTPSCPPQRTTDNYSDGDGDGDSASDSAKKKLAHIRRLYSHPQAFGQCSRFLARYLPPPAACARVDVDSTSRAATLARDAGPGAGVAAVSSAEAAQRLGLQVLARDVEDRKDNTTRFFVLRRGGGGEEGGKEGGGGCGGMTTGMTGTTTGMTGTTTGTTTTGMTNTTNSNKNNNTRSLVRFVPPPRAPAALADVLDCFRRRGLDLVSIRSRPALLQEPDHHQSHHQHHQPAEDNKGQQRPWDQDQEDGAAGGGGGGREDPFQYVYFVEFRAHGDDDGDRRVRAALDGVARAVGGGGARRWRWLGTWVEEDRSSRR